MGRTTGRGVCTFPRNAVGVATAGWYCESHVGEHFDWVGDGLTDNPMVVGGLATVYSMGKQSPMDWCRDAHSTVLRQGRRQSEK
ncbi:MAG: hypothetical protein VX589_10030 [Myxococcota bacterium]|nr:hypothetical protein [Myxococcota bacterium]